VLRSANEPDFRVGEVYHDRLGQLEVGLQTWNNSWIAAAPGGQPVG
jgi:hypothetical protein